jgi:hypothetical protein
VRHQAKLTSVLDMHVSFTAIHLSLDWLPRHCFRDEAKNRYYSVKYGPGVEAPNLQIPLNEYPVDRQLAAPVDSCWGWPAFYQPHRLEITPHPIHAHRWAVFEREVFRVFREDGTNRRVRSI